MYDLIAMRVQHSLLSRMLQHAALPDDAQKRETQLLSMSNRSINVSKKAV